MKNFTCVQDIGNLKSALDEAFEIKKDRFKYVELGRNKTLMMIFFNSSLRTRLSTQKAALNLGIDQNEEFLELSKERREEINDISKRTLYLEKLQKQAQLFEDKEIQTLNEPLVEYGQDLPF